MCKNNKYHNKSLINSTVILTFLSLLGLIPQYLIRSNLAISMWFYQKFTTYPGDLWYCWNNYLNVGRPYPREYPSLIQILFRIINLIPGVNDNYTYYLIFPVFILSICAVICSCILYKLHPQLKPILWLWLFAPSYLFYGLFNLDFLPIVMMIASYYYFKQNKYVPSAIYLAIGTAIKVFPIFLFPIYFFSCTENKEKIRLLVVCICTWAIINIPFMLIDWNSWAFPYMWQIQSNFAKTASDGSWTWLIFKSFAYFGHGEWSGKISLLIFILLYGYLIKKYWHLSLARKLLIVIILFLLTDRVYSPQYNLYLLPFLILVDYKINWKYFYMLELPNFVQVFFVFTLKQQPIIQQGIIFVKYIALIMLLLQAIGASTINKKVEVN